jgi:hypothetical protein
VKFKLDENLSPSLAEMFAAGGHDAHSVAQQALGGQPDAPVIHVCNREQRALVTLDLGTLAVETTVPLHSLCASRPKNHRSPAPAGALVAHMPATCIGGASSPA